MTKLGTLESIHSLKMINANFIIIRSNIPHYEFKRIQKIAFDCT